MSDKPLGRRIPTSWEHVERYGLAALALPSPPPHTERSLGLPWWWKQYDQGEEGSCVGFGCSSMMSITNHLQRYQTTGQNITYRYAAPWLYNQAQLVDEWPETPPEEGTTVRAGCDVLRDIGHRRVQNGVAGAPNLKHGISENRWASSFDEVRAAIFAGLAVAIGVNWYSNFDDPELFNGEMWIGISRLGRLRGGHCLTAFRMSDRRQAFRLMNSWGAAYPPVWIPYEVLQRLLNEEGEAAVITDR